MTTSTQPPQDSASPEPLVVATGASLPELSDGTLVTSAEDGRGFLVVDGRLRPVDDIGVLLAANVDPTRARHVLAPAETLRNIEAAVGPAAAGVSSVDSGEQFLGAGHYMRTWGSINWSTGAVAMQTRTRTITMFGGFHGSSGFICRDPQQGPTFQSQSHRFGVDGTWIGRSDRTDAWWENMGPDAAAKTSELVWYQAWAPDSFQTILDKWVAAGKSVSELVTSAASVAKVFSQPAK